MRRILIACLVTFALVAAGCADEPQATPDASPEPAPLRVATTLYPFAWLVSEISPEAEVVRLAQHTAADPHDVQLSPGELQTLRTADVVVHVGEVGYQPEVERALREAQGIVVEALDFVDPLTLEDDHGHDHNDEDGVDPHVWQSPAAMARIAEGLGRALAEADAEGRETYEANAARAAADLEALDAEIDDALAGCTHDEVVLSHAGYAYMLEPRGIHQEAVTGPGGHGEPAPRRLSELTRKIRDEGLPIVLAEPVEGRPAAEALARETNVEVVDIHPLGTVTAQEAQRGYPALIRENVAAFARALSCPGTE